MKLVHILSLATLTTFLGIQPAASQPSISAPQAERLRATIHHARDRVASILQRARSGGGRHENDALAEPRLNDAYASLNQAAEAADDATKILNTPPVDFGRASFRFTQACGKSAIARSQVARARIGAAAPPPGKYTVFLADFDEVVTELQELRKPFPDGVGCP